MCVGTTRVDDVGVVALQAAVGVEAGLDEALVLAQHAVEVAVARSDMSRRMRRLRCVFASVSTNIFMSRSSHPGFMEGEDPFEDDDGGGLDQAIMIVGHDGVRDVVVAGHLHLRVPGPNRLQRAQDALEVKGVRVVEVEIRSVRALLLYVLQDSCGSTATLES